MKKSLLFLLLALIIYSCSDFNNDNFLENKNDSIQKESDSLFVTLTVGQLININNDFFVKLDSVLSDSRCPEEMICVWEGNVEISLNFQKLNHISNYTLNSYLEPREIYFSNYKIRINNVFPNPSSTRIILPKDYQIQLLFFENS